MYRYFLLMLAVSTITCSDLKTYADFRLSLEMSKDGSDFPDIVVVDQLLSFDHANPNVKAHQDDKSPLFKALRLFEADEQLALLLLRFGADALEQTKPPLIELAAQAGMRKVVRMLIKHGARATDQAVSEAISTGMVALIHDLLVAGGGTGGWIGWGTKPIIRGTRYARPLDIARERHMDDIVQLLELFQQYGRDALINMYPVPDPHVQDHLSEKEQHQATKSIRAMAKDRSLSVEAARALAVDIDPEDGKYPGHTLLHVVLDARFSFTKPLAPDAEELALFLINEKKAPINAHTRFLFATPLHLAARAGFKVVTQALIERKANINALDTYDNAPLHDAAANGHKEVVQQLLDAGALITLRNKKYEPNKTSDRQLSELCIEKSLTAEELAREYGHHEIADLLASKKVEQDAVDTQGKCTVM